MGSKSAATDLSTQCQLYLITITSGHDHMFRNQVNKHVFGNQIAHSIRSNKGVLMESNWAATDLSTQCQLYLITITSGHDHMFRNQVA